MRKTLDFHLLTLVRQMLREKGQQNVYFAQYEGMVMPCHILSIQDVSQDPYGAMGLGVSAILMLEVMYMTQDFGMQGLLEQAHNLTRWLDGHRFVMEDWGCAVFKHVHQSIGNTTEGDMKVMQQKYNVLIRRGRNGA